MEDTIHRSHHNKNETGHSPEIEGYINSTVEWIDATIGINGKRVLDVGADYGHLLHLCLLRGAQTSSCAVEPFESFNPYSLQIHTVKFEYFKDDNDELFDLIVFNHSLEHLDNPYGLLEKARSLLKPTGHIFLGLPDCGFEWAYREGHTSLWNDKFTLVTLERTGFKPIDLQHRCFRDSNVELWAIGAVSSNH